MPLFHGNAIMALWAPALSVGATVCLTPTFSASGFLPDVRFFGATFFTYVGKALAYLMATPETPRRRRQPADPRIRYRGLPGATRPSSAGASAPNCSKATAPARAVTRPCRIPDAPAGALGRPAHGGVVIVDPETLEPVPAAILDSSGRVLNADDAVGEIVDQQRRP